ncbi:MAG: L-lactate dehydrogenase [Micavibrio aeruginosavorus]|uniref:L-lactate dehydrogenase n=1 Tax=Micavibrio aeruginosavorus TaxID=349221 RepID=A0A7T5R3C3_9BACT|nr:MAG: L-lactate dehydrogenase [Micavibrio aeruginosavorus]
MKIGVVGTGLVGGACANACVLRGVGTELVLVDHNSDLAMAQAEDIFHATPFAQSMPVRAGSYDDLEGCGIVMVAAGVNQKPGESRLDLLKRNADIFRRIVPDIIKAAPQAILLIATNPVDIMAHLATEVAQESGIAAHRVIGSGTILDTARFRALLARHLGISSHSIHAYVLGEHGDSEMLHWSGVTVGTVSLPVFAADMRVALTDAVRDEIDRGVRQAAARIIRGKGATYYGIGAGMARIARGIIENEQAVITCTQLHPEIEGIRNVALSLPVIINAQGVAHIVHPALAGNERQALARSAEILRHAADAIGCR